MTSAAGAREWIVCAVDGSAPAAVAVEQALVLGADDALVEFVSVAPETGFAPGRYVAQDREQCEHAVEEALARAAAAGVRARGSVPESDDPAATLVEAADGADLLVAGGHAGSRGAGIALGSVATALVHRARCPVLLARRPPEGVAFPSRIVVASDGSEHAGKAVALAGELARRHGARIWLLGVDARLGEHTRLLADVLGELPLKLERSGDAHEEIAAAAADADAALLVVGARGLGGVKALGSVSERVAHEARCSVLVVRR